MQEPFKRYFQISIGIIGAISSGVFIMLCLKSTSAPSPIRAAAIAGVTYQQATQPSQYWFILFLSGVTFAGFAWLAWHAYRG